MGETPEYTKRAIQKYNNKFDRVAVNLPKGSKERIKMLTGKSCSAFMSELALTELDKLEGKENKLDVVDDDLPEFMRD